MRWGAKYTALGTCHKSATLQNKVLSHIPRIAYAYSYDQSAEWHMVAHEKSILWFCS